MLLSRLATRPLHILRKTANASFRNHQSFRYLSSTILEAHESKVEIVQVRNLPLGISSKNFADILRSYITK